MSGPKIAKPSVTPTVKQEADDSLLETTSTRDYRSKIQAGRDAADSIREKARKEAQEKAIEERKAEEMQESMRRQAALNDWAHRVETSGVRIDERGRQVTPDDALNDQITNVLRPEQRAFDDWRAAMMSLLGLFAAFVEAWDHTQKGVLANVFAGVFNKAREKGYKIYNEKFRTFEEKDIPALLGRLKFSDEGGFLVGNLDNASDVEFQSLVASWLGEQGYDFDEKRGYTLKGEPLTKKAFHEIAVKNDFSGFLEKTIGLSVDLAVELPELDQAQDQDEEPCSTPSMI